MVRGAEFSGVKAQTPCRNERVIWEIRVKACCCSGRNSLMYGLWLIDQRLRHQLDEAFRAGNRPAAPVA
jgi:hypothetical protein